MNRLWRTAGALCIAHPVLLLAGYSQMKSPSFGAVPSAIADAYAGVPGTKMYLGGYLATIAWFVLIVLVTLLARLLRGTGDTWLSGLISTAGVTATAVTLAGAFATAGAAYYGARHGYGADVVAGTNYVAKFADLISIVGMGLCAAAIGGAGLASRALPRWASALSLAVGALGIAAGANSGLMNLETLVWLAWLVVLGVVLMRGPARTRQTSPAPAPAALVNAS
jgi:hypothetical protein